MMNGDMSCRVRWLTYWSEWHIDNLAPHIFDMGT